MVLEENMYNLEHELWNHCYEPGPCYCFVVHEKIRREVYAPRFRDRVVSHLLFNYLNPFFERTFIHDSASCRKGRGTSFGISRLEHHIRSESRNYTVPCKALKIDIKGCFMSINKRILYDIILDEIRRGRFRKTAGILWNDIIDFDFCIELVRVTLFHDPTVDSILLGRPEDWEGIPKSKILKCAPEGCGLTIGNLLSQLWANVILNVLDQFVKRELKVRHWVRYVDDMYAVSQNEEFLRDVLSRIDSFLRERLLMRINCRKVRVYDIRQNISFLGACCRPFRRYIQNVTVRSFRNAAHEIHAMLSENPTRENIALCLSRINSYTGMVRHFKAYNIAKAIVAAEELERWFEFDDGYTYAKVRVSTTTLTK